MGPNQKARLVALVGRSVSTHGLCISPSGTFYSVSLSVCAFQKLHVIPKFYILHLHSI